MRDPVGADIDPLTNDSEPDTCWTRTNIAEAIPGVASPLGWSFFGPALDVGLRRGFHQLGVIPRSAVEYPERVDERVSGVFHGRVTVNVSTTRAIMRGFPGVTGDDVERDIIGSVRKGVVDRSYGFRLPAVVMKAGVALLTSGRAAATVIRQTRAWWSQRFGPTGIVDGTDPRTALSEAMEKFQAAVVAQARNRMLYQGASSHLVALATGAGYPDLSGALLSGPAGLEEAAVAVDLRRLAADRMDLQTFISRHGFHGPDSGNIMSRSWREDPGPIERLSKTLQGRSEGAPRSGAGARDTAAGTVLGQLPAPRRWIARAVLRLTPVAARNLERSKISMAMAIDGARAAARAAGTELVAEGFLDLEDDAFFLFVEELLGEGNSEMRSRVAQRRRNYERHRSMDLADATWTGVPRVRRINSGPVDSARTATEVTGIGASPGEVEGTVKVVLDAGAETEVEFGEILVCPVTDPSWVLLMTVASALVIDIGGTASHGAIVARELGVPCVIGTGDGTRVLRSGDRVRVDGRSGVVTILSRADDR